MKIKIDIKSLVLVILVLSVCASVISAQKQQKPVKQGVWQDVKLERWGLKFSIPTDLKETTSKEENEPISTDGNFTESRTFERSTPKASRLQLSVYLRNAKGEKIKTENNGKEVELSPEQLLTLDYIGDSGDAKRADSPTVEADYQEIDGVNGIFVVRNVSWDAGKTVKSTNDIRVIWGTYRLFRGNVQQIMFSVEGKRTQLETMKKIINSLKFN